MANTVIMEFNTVQIIGLRNALIFTVENARNPMLIAAAKHRLDEVEAAMKQQVPSTYNRVVSP